MGDWKKCPDCQAARAKKGQGDNVEVQMSDFTKSLTTILSKHRKKPILWYDINKSYYHKGETVMSWLPGEFPRCIDKTKEQGIDLIVTPPVQVLPGAYPDEIPRRTTCAPGPAELPSC